jgi:hypothetical protein
LPGKVVRFQLDGKLQADGSRFKVPQMGWNRVRQSRAHPLWKASRQQLFLFRAQLLRPAGQPGHTIGEADYGGAVLLRGRARQYRRDPVPPGEKRRRRPAACTRISFTGILEFPFPLFPLTNDTDHAADPRHRPERRSLRSPETGRYGPRHRVLRRSRRDGAALAEERRAPPAPGRPERRIRGQAEERSGDQIDPERRAGIAADNEIDEIPVQLGGGIRDLDTIERYLDDGITYIIVGTAAVKNPGFLHDACGAFPGSIIVGLDAKDGKVATDGWSKMSGHEVIDLARSSKATASNRSSTPTSAATA